MDAPKKITQHQPEPEIADLSCTESLDDYSDDSDMEGCNVESEFSQASRRWLRYANHYHDLFEQFYDDARGGQVSKNFSDERTRDEVVEEWIWKVMEHDMKHLEDYME